MPLRSKRAVLVVFLLWMCGFARAAKTDPPAPMAASPANGPLQQDARWRAGRAGRAHASSHPRHAAGSRERGGRGGGGAPRHRSRRGAKAAGARADHPWPRDFRGARAAFAPHRWGGTRPPPPPQPSPRRGGAGGHRARQPQEGLRRFCAQGAGGGSPSFPRERQGPAARAGGARAVPRDLLRYRPGCPHGRCRA